MTWPLAKIALKQSTGWVAERSQQHSADIYNNNIHLHGSETADEKYTFVRVNYFCPLKSKFHFLMSPDNKDAEPITG